MFLIIISHSDFPLTQQLSIFCLISYIYNVYITQSITRRAATTTTTTRQTEQQFAIVAYFDKCNEYTVAVAPACAVHSP